MKFFKVTFWLLQPINRNTIIRRALSNFCSWFKINWLQKFKTSTKVFFTLFWWFAIWQQLQLWVFFDKSLKALHNWILALCPIFPGRSFQALSDYIGTICELTSSGLSTFLLEGLSLDFGRYTQGQSDFPWSHFSRGLSCATFSARSDANTFLFLIPSQHLYKLMWTKGENWVFIAKWTILRVHNLKQSEHSLKSAYLEYELHFC